MKKTIKKPQAKVKECKGMDCTNMKQPRSSYCKGCVTNIKNSL